MMKKNCLLFFCCLAILALLSACQITTPVSGTRLAPEPVVNDNVVTIQPDIATQAATQPLPQATVLAAELPSITYTIEAVSTTGQLIATPKEEAHCDVVTAGVPVDVTIPDGTRVHPRETFTKTWRLVNTGACSWTRDYALVWFSGDLLSPVTLQTISRDVPAGQAVDLSIDLVAPPQPGIYQSNWKLRNGSGTLFGLGPTGDAPFWVKVEVFLDSTATSEVEPTQAPTLPVNANGVANLLLNDTLDLDNGDINPGSGMDIRYQLDAGQKDQILPVNPARIGVFGSRVPLEQDCQNAILGQGGLVLPGLDQGVYLCYYTGSGLPGYMHILRPDENDNIISIDFVTWSVP